MKYMTKMRDLCSLKSFIEKLVQIQHVWIHHCLKLSNVHNILFELDTPSTAEGNDVYRERGMFIGQETPAL